MKVVFALCLILAFADAKGSKIKIEDIMGNITNIDVMISGMGTPDTVCALIWKKRFKNGTVHTGTELKLNQIRAVYSFNDTDFIGRDGKVITWRDKCTDTTLGDWDLYQPVIYFWQKDKIKKFRDDSINRYVIEEADLTKDQKDKISEGKKNFVSLGNHRIKKEIK